MPYTAVYGISQEVEKIVNAEIEAKGNTLLKATYTGLGLFETLEEAILMAVPMVKERFGGETLTTIASIDGKLTEMRFVSNDYAPMGQTEIPLIFISQVELDVSEDVAKYFEVDLGGADNG